MKCAEAKQMFSPYLDGAVSGTEMHALREHLSGCSHCDREYALLRQTQELVFKIGRRKPPADLALKLRVAISREAAAAKRPAFQGLRVRLENAMHAFMVPATAGTIAAIAIFGFVMGLTLPALQARNIDDVPLMLYTGPELEESSFATTINVLEGLLAHERATGGSAESIAARRRGEEYLLERKLARRKSTGEVVNPAWLQFSFPTRWHYDVLRGLEYFRSVGDVPDSRMDEAIDLLRSKQQPDGTWLLENTHPGKVHFALEDGDSRPSRWNTLRALRVLNWWGPRA